MCTSQTTLDKLRKTSTRRRYLLASMSIRCSSNSELTPKRKHTVPSQTVNNTAYNVQCTLISTVSVCWLTLHTDDTSQHRYQSLPLQPGSSPQSRQAHLTFPRDWRKSCEFSGKEVGQVWSVTRFTALIPRRRLICPALLSMYKHQKAFCLRVWPAHQEPPLHLAGGSASRPPLETRPVVHPTF